MKPSSPAAPRCAPGATPGWTRSGSATRSCCCRSRKTTPHLDDRDRHRAQLGAPGQHFPQGRAIAYGGHAQSYFPSPLAGEGCGALASASELRRSWMRGSAPTGARSTERNISDRDGPRPTEELSLSDQLNPDDAVFSAPRCAARAAPPLACSVWRESVESMQICVGSTRAAARVEPDRRDRAPLGVEPWMSLVRRSFAPVLNR